VLRMLRELILRRTDLAVGTCTPDPEPQLLSARDTPGLTALVLALSFTQSMLALMVFSVSHATIYLYSSLLIH